MRINKDAAERQRRQQSDKDGKSDLDKIQTEVDLEVCATEVVRSEAPRRTALGVTYAFINFNTSELNNVGVVFRALRSQMHWINK